MARLSAPPRRSCCGNGSQLPFVERPQHVAVGIEALVHFEAQRVAGQQRGALLVKLIEVRAVLAADDQHIGKARRRQQRSDGAAAFEQGIGGHGHAVDDHELGEGEGDAVSRSRSRNPCSDRAALIVGRGRHLVDAQPAVLPDHEVGEGAADVDADAGSACYASLSLESVIFSA